MRYDNARSTEPSSDNGIGGKKRMYDDGPMTASGGGDPSKKTKSLRNIDDEIRRLQEALSSSDELTTKRK